MVLYYSTLSPMIFVGLSRVKYLPTPTKKLSDEYQLPALSRFFSRNNIESAYLREGIGEILVLVIEAVVWHWTFSSSPGFCRVLEEASFVLCPTKLNKVGKQ